MNTRFKAIIPPLAAEERAQLEQNILRDGIREPLVVWGDTLIDGHNRLAIAQEHGLTYDTVQMHFDSDGAAIEWIVTNQFGRRNINAFQRAELAQVLEPIIAEKAQENLRIYGGNQHESGPSQNSEKVQPVDTYKETAKLAGISHDTYARAKKISAFGSPELIEQVRAGDVSIHQGYQTVRRAAKEESRERERQVNAEKVRALDNPLDAQGLFQTVVVDPPWDWGDEGDVNQLGRAKPDYATMPIEKIRELPIAKIADANSHLYLWVTNRSLPKAFGLIDAWGFRYITCLTWVKPHYGMGNYFRGSTEQVLFAVKGSQPLKRKDAATHFEAPRGQGHSAKPEAFYELVESCSPGPYIDVFGRKERPGWTVWGEGG